jgi:hypothetical protein
MARIGGAALATALAVFVGLGGANRVLAAAATASGSNASEVFTRVPVPPLQLRPGDVIAPLPAGSPLPSGDPRDLEGVWAGVGATLITDGQPIPYLPAVQAEMNRRRSLDVAGTPIVDKGALCRPPGSVAVTGNQFPTLIIQRPDKIVILAEENRGIWPIYMNAQHPKDLRPSFAGHSVGHWEGNTLVVDSIGFNG